MGLGAALALLILAPAGCGDGAAVPARDGARKPPVVRRPLVIGSVSRDPAGEHRRFAPLLDLLSQLEVDGTGWQPSLEVLPDIPLMAGALRSGAVDLYMDSCVPVVQAERQSGGEVALAWHKHGLESYASVVFTRRDSGVKALGDLRGGTLVLSAPSSTSGYLLPVAVLRQAGLAVASQETVREDGAVRVLLSGDAENTMFWVLEGRGSAGAVADEYYEKLAGIRGPELRVLARSPAVPRGLVCVRPGMSPGEMRQVTAAFLRLGTPPWQARLRAFEGTTGFAVPDPERLAAARRITAMLASGGGS